MLVLALVACAPQLRGADRILAGPLTLSAQVWGGAYGSLQLQVPTDQGPVCVQDTLFQAVDPIAEYQRGVRVADGYLFLPSSCGGCNGAAGVGYQVFVLSPTVRSLGYFSGGKDLPWEGGRFWTLETTLEANELTSHADGTVLQVALSPTAQGLKVDQALTWERNARFYDEALAVAAVAPSEAERDAPTGTLLRGAALCRFLGRARRERAALARARARLGAATYARLVQQLDLLKPLVVSLAPFTPCEARP
jgi:hypothetical protein